MSLNRIPVAVVDADPRDTDLYVRTGFDKLLIILDGSEFAERVLPYGSVALLLRVLTAPEPQQFDTVEG